MVVHCSWELKKKKKIILQLICVCSYGGYV